MTQPFDDLDRLLGDVAAQVQRKPKKAHGTTEKQGPGLGAQQVSQEISQADANAPDHEVIAQTPEIVGAHAETAEEIAEEIAETKEIAHASEIGGDGEYPGHEIAEAYLPQSFYRVVPDTEASCEGEEHGSSCVALVHVPGALSAWERVRSMVGAWLDAGRQHVGYLWAFLRRQLDQYGLAREGQYRRNGQNNWSAPLGRGVRVAHQGLQNLWGKKWVRTLLVEVVASVLAIAIGVGGGVWGVRYLRHRGESRASVGDSVTQKRPEGEVAKTVRPVQLSSDTSGRIGVVAAANATSDTWIDSIDAPPEFLRGDLPKILGPRPLGKSAATASNGPNWSGHTTAKATTRDWMLVRRVGGANVALYSLAGKAEDVANVVGRSMNVPALCNTPIQVTGSSGNHATGRVSDGMGTWIFALAVDGDACRTAAQEAAQRTVVGSDVREALARMASRGGVNFQVHDLRDVVVANVQGKKLAWGVFRRPVQTTQLIPPPSAPQLAFVAEQRNGEWVPLWSMNATSSLEALGLAGVYDITGDGIPEAFFARRAIDGKEFVIELARMGDVWAQTQIQPLN